MRPLIIQAGTAWKASLPAVLGKTRRTEWAGSRPPSGWVYYPYPYPYSYSYSYCYYDIFGVLWCY